MKFDAVYLIFYAVSNGIFDLSTDDTTEATNGKAKIFDSTSIFSFLNRDDYRTFVEETETCGSTVSLNTMTTYLSLAPIPYSGYIYTWEDVNVLYSR